jgi:hypothetical protein
MKLIEIHNKIERDHKVKLYKVRDKSYTELLYLRCVFINAAKGFSYSDQKIADFLGFKRPQIIHYRSKIYPGLRFDPEYAYLLEYEQDLLREIIPVPYYAKKCYTLGRELTALKEKVQKLKIMATIDFVTLDKLKEEIDKL